MTTPTPLKTLAAEHVGRTRGATPAQSRRGAARSALHGDRRPESRAAQPRVRRPAPRSASPGVRRGSVATRAASGPTASHREHAAFRALRSSSGVGAAVIACEPDWIAGENRWTVLVTDADAYRYVEIRSREVPPGRYLPPAVIEQGVEEFAAGLPAGGRLCHLINACPLHLGRNGVVFD